MLLSIQGYIHELWGFSYFKFCHNKVRENYHIKLLFSSSMNDRNSVKFISLHISISMSDGTIHLLILVKFRKLCSIFFWSFLFKIIMNCTDLIVNGLIAK